MNLLCQEGDFRHFVNYVRNKMSKTWTFAYHGQNYSTDTHIPNAKLYFNPGV